MVQIQIAQHLAKTLFLSSLELVALQNGFWFFDLSRFGHDKGVAIKHLSQFPAAHRGKEMGPRTFPGLMTHPGVLFDRFFLFFGVDGQFGGPFALG